MIELSGGSFDGITFSQIAPVGGEIGRRIIVNEFPGLDRITIDDMGANAEVVVFNVVFTGKDWRERYRAMLDRLRRGGPGELEHPEGWRRQAVVRGVTSYQLESVGKVTMTLAFVFVDDQKSLSSQPVTEEATQTAADKTRTKAVRDYEEVHTSAVQKITDTILRGLPSAGSAVVLSAARKLGNDLARLAVSPVVITRAWLNFFEAITDTTALQQIANHYIELYADLERLGLGFAPSAAELTAAAREQAKLAALCAVTSASEAVTAENYSDILSATRNYYAITALCDRAAAKLDLDAEGLEIIQDLKVALIRQLNMLVLRLPESRIITTSYTVPALVLAYDLYADAQRASEIVRRNGIAHPGWISAGSELDVLAT